MTVETGAAALAGAGCHLVAAAAVGVAATYQPVRPEAVILATLAWGAGSALFVVAGVQAASGVVG